MRSILVLLTSLIVGRLSLQLSNTIILLEGATMKMIHIFKVPTLLRRPASESGLGKDAPAGVVGGPHCIREDPKTGDIYVALKGKLQVLFLWLIKIHKWNMSLYLSTICARGLYALLVLWPNVRGMVANVL